MRGDRATAIVSKDDKILLIHRFKAGDEFYTLPGGHVEEDESVEQAVLRELKEETSIEATLGERVLYFVSERGRAHHLYLCNYVSGTPKLSETSDEAAAKPEENIYIPMWVEKNKLKELKMWPAETKPFLLKYFKIN